MSNGAGSGSVSGSEGRRMAPMIPRERCDYSAIVDRPPLKLPGGARIAFWTIVNLRGLGHRAADGAPGAAGADRSPAAARRGELGLARIRHAGRLLALLRALRAARHPPDARRQCARLRGLSARRREARDARLGVHGPRLRAEADPQGRGPGRHDRQVDGHDREIHRQAAGRLARPRPDPDHGDPGAARRGRRQIHRRLGL